MTAALRTRADPVDLIPGSLEALYSDADDLDTAKARLREAELTVRHQVIASWFGGAASGWHERRRTIADSLSGVGEVYGVVAEVLRAHADVLAWAREQAAVAVELWEAADREAWTDGVQCYEPQTQGLVLTPPGLWGASRTAATPYGHAAAPDPGAPTRALAVQVLEDARSQVLFSNQAAAEVLDELSAGLPDGRWHTGSFLAGLWDWVVGVVTIVAKFNQYRAVFDYDGVLADSAEMRAQLQSTGQFLAQDPDEIPGVLFDSQGLRDDPARWWGAAAPDIALTVAGGVGALSRSGTLARLSEDLAARRSAAESARATARVFTSKDPLVAEVATRLDEALPGRIKSVNSDVVMHNGRVREVDIDLGRVVVQVKSGNARHLTGQMLDTLATTDRVVVAYAPDIPPGAWRHAAHLGLPVARDMDELLAILGEVR